MAAKAAPKTPPRAIWTRQARNLVAYRLKGPVRLGALERLASEKARILEFKPKDSTPADAELAAILGDQVEGLQLLVVALRGGDYDRDKLGELTVREAHRLGRRDVIVELWPELKRPPQGVEQPLL